MKAIPPDHQWKLIGQAVFTEPPAGAYGHLRIYCDAACVAIIPVADSSQEAVDRAIQLGQYLADAVNKTTSTKDKDDTVITWTELDWIRQNDRISAIKSIRKRTNCSLRDAIDLVEVAKGLIPKGNP